MPRNPKTLVFVGIRNTVVALDDRTGVEVWRAVLSGSDFVTVVWDGEALLAANNGEVFRLDPVTGATLWQNPLKKLGRGVVSLATSRAPSNVSGDTAAMALQRARQQAAAVAAAT
jgi:outer membrane protein assembly factor BamB